jgi:fatty acid desaturase
MYIPCYNLPRFHRLLLAKGFGPRMELQPDYVTVLRMATSRPEGSAGKRVVPGRENTAEGNVGTAFNISSRPSQSD